MTIEIIPIRVRDNPPDVAFRFKSWKICTHITADQKQERVGPMRSKIDGTEFAEYIQSRAQKIISGFHDN